MARVAGQRRRPVDSTPAGPVPPEGPATAPPRDLQEPPPTAPTPAREPAVGAVGAPRGPDLLVVGRIGKPQGIRGEVTVEVRTDDPQARFAEGAVLLTDPAERGPLTVQAARWQNGRLMVGFAGVEDRNGAEQLRGTLLQIDGAMLPAPEDEDEFHDHVLRGMTAIVVGGAVLGAVVDVLHLPHGDVLVVRRADNGNEVLVPFVKAMVPDVDVVARVLAINPPEGLLELTDSPEVTDSPGPDEPTAP